MVDPKHISLSVNEQCKLLGIHRSGLYYKPVGESPLNLHLMKIIDKEIFDKPFYGVRRMTAHLRIQGHRVNRKRIERLYRLMNIKVQYPKKNLSKPNKGHKKYPYLLRGLKIDRPNQVWTADITWIPMQRGFMYMFCIIDLHSRYVINWSISNSMDAAWCADVLKEAIQTHGKPEIFNTDQGSQFTSITFTSLLKRNNIRISMDGKGRAIDNIFIERLFRSVKQEYVYINPANGGLKLYEGMKKYFEFYNNERPHQSLKYKTPNQVFETMKKVA
jgi:putative transposase